MTISFNRPRSLPEPVEGSKGKVNTHYMHFVALTSILRQAQQSSSASGFIQMLTICIISKNIVQMKEPRMLRIKDYIFANLHTFAPKTIRYD